MVDPIEIGARTLAERWRREPISPDSRPEDDIRAAFEELHAAGWRIVRPLRLIDSGDIHPSFIEGISDEWLPEATP